MNVYADVIINRKSDAIDHVFTYEVPAALQQSICPGMLVQVPFQREVLEGVVVALRHDAPEGFALRPIKAAVGERPLFPADLLALSQWLGEYYLCPRVAALQAMLPAGMSLSGKAPRIYYQDVYTLAEGWQMLRLTPKRRALAELLQHGPHSAEALQQEGFRREFLRAAEKAGLVRKERCRAVEDATPAAVTETVFSPAQQQVYDAILAEQQGANRPFLLHGATGSGKTELYLRLIRTMAEQGKQSIVLVPEIALSAQMVSMLMQRLEMPIAVLHSGLKPAERRHIWQEIAEGRYACVVGARSAVFAPLPQLGLIIMDEAHETSYKQDNVPRFHAQTVAEERARLCGASLLLGSATPSLEQMYDARSGRYALGVLKERYHGAPPPQVDVVDMRLELAAGNRSIFSRTLLDALEETLQQGEQAILFLNRRGYYQHYACRDCGSSISCPHCAVAMNLHAEGPRGRLKCHYCGRSMEPPRVCPHCGSQHIRKFGVGTQRVVDELAKCFPTARILRMDSDVMQERGSHERIYRTMREGGADILVGTQMVAKGLDLPKLTLAAAISADMLLNLPDWRAAERTFQLLTQLVGRAGRRTRQGRAVIQTYLPQAQAIAAAAGQDYERFYLSELVERELHDYPPFCKLVRVVFSGLNSSMLATLSSAYAHYLQPLLPEQTTVLGPADAPLAKIKDRYRRHLIIKTADLDAVRQAVRQAQQMLLEKERVGKDILISIDIEPFGMM